MFTPLLATMGKVFVEWVSYKLDRETGDRDT